MTFFNIPESDWWVFSIEDPVTELSIAVSEENIPDSNAFVTERDALLSLLMEECFLFKYATLWARIGFSAEEAVELIQKGILDPKEGI